MSAWESLTENRVRMLAGPDVFARGRAYLAEGRVLELVRRGEVVHAEVEGSDVDPYEVTLSIDADGKVEADCTCPYEWGTCKHVVAALLALVSTPDRVEVRPPLPELLAPLSRDALQALLLELAGGDPALASRVELLAARHAAPAAAPGRSAMPPVDPRQVEREIEASLRGLRRGRHYDERQVGESVHVFNQTAARARPHLEAGDAAGALVYLSAVAERATEDIEELLGDEGLEIGELFREVGELLAEAFLTAELSPQERQDWADRVAVWEARVGDYGYEESFGVARVAAAQGWDYAPLQCVLQGGTPDEAADLVPEDDDSEDYAVALAELRLKLLERQERWEEYLRLAAAAGLEEQFVTALVRLGRMSAAVEYGVTGLSAPNVALTLAKALDAAGAPAEALRVAEHWLSRGEGEPIARPELARWTRDLAARLGRNDLALQAALAAARSRSGLQDYLAVAPLAGERWPELREELLEALRRGPRSYYPTAEVEIFLHEGLIDDAIAAVDAAPGHELVALVVDAASATHPDWVFRACKHQFDRIADAGNAPYYHEAAAWLAKAKASLQAAGKDAEWRRYLGDAIARHQRKYKLRPLLEKLR